MEKTIKIEGYSEGDMSVGIGDCEFSIDTGLTKLDDNDRKFIIKEIISNIWELHDNGDLHFDFSDEAKEDDWDYKRRFGYDENILLLKEGIVGGLK